MVSKRLREGFTTGSAAAAAAKAALLFMEGGNMVKEVDIPLPVGGRLSIPVENVEQRDDGVRAVVTKDAGDDPDVTHRAKIGATVKFLSGRPNGQVIIDGGEGVGKVTRPGLPVPVGEPAINPVPRQQIIDAVREALSERGKKGSVSVIIDVVDGEKIAKKTFNPRLGIIGGISILGTRGTVKPFSNKAYRDTITTFMDVARAEGVDTIALSTGGKSEGFLKRERPQLPEFTFIQVADFFSFSLEEAARRGFQSILYACFFGKIIKMAQGHPYTHARKSRINFTLLARWCTTLGMAEEMAYDVAQANTARQARGIILTYAGHHKVFKGIVKRAIASAREFAGPAPHITYYLFDFDGTLLATLTDTGGGGEHA